MVIAPQLPYAGVMFGLDFLPVLHQGTRIIAGPEPIPNMKRRAATADIQTTNCNSPNISIASIWPTGGRLEPFRAHQVVRDGMGCSERRRRRSMFRRSLTRRSRLYGLERGSTIGFGWQCLVARRLAERGVRFVELIDGGTSIDHNWGCPCLHAGVQQACAGRRQADRRTAADLKSRGCSQDTVVVWTTEFGRSPTVPDPTAEGRGHHATAYGPWVAAAASPSGKAY